MNEEEYERISREVSRLMEAEDSLSDAELQNLSNLVDEVIAYENAAGYTLPSPSPKAVAEFRREQAGELVAV